MKMFQFILKGKQKNQKGRGDGSTGDGSVCNDFFLKLTLLTVFGNFDF